MTRTLTLIAASLLLVPHFDFVSAAGGRCEGVGSIEEQRSEISGQNPAEKSGPGNYLAFCIFIFTH